MHRSARGMTVRSLIRRLRRHARLKVWLSALTWVGFCVPYLLIQRLPLFPPWTFPLTGLDRWAGFEPLWAWVYQSAYGLIAAGPWLAASRAALRIYIRGFGFVCAVGFLAFLLFPVAGPRPTDTPPSGLYALVLLYDHPTNSFPSLHVGLVAQSLLFAAWMVRRERGRSTGAWLLLAGGALWGLLICYSTLATKQHYAVDVPAGILLAWAGHRFAVWRPGSRHPHRRLWT